ncbi:hypothetical protein F1880_009242 [Penicillium rolfsii]|nr:hypothetical protein F1880_009242 [Penicillium rolfsii]
MHHATPLEMGLALPGPFGVLSDRHDHPQLLARVCREGHQDPQAAWAIFRSVGSTADAKEDPHMDRLDSADKHEEGNDEGKQNIALVVLAYLTQMETGAEQLIHQWLANLPEGAPSQPDCDAEGFKAADLEPNGGLFTGLEPTDAGPAIRLPKINKRPREDSADHGQRVLQDSTWNQYAKRPRRKTRDDKYEYKGPSSSRNRPFQPQQNRGKRSRNSKKHTMNDEFHAFNVARNRLTLRNPMNMGIFSKGKASSPTKVGDGSTSQDHLKAIPRKTFDMHSQQRRSVQQTPSPKPYSWSVSDRHESQQSPEVEARLLKILHAGLSPQAFGHQAESTKSMNGYCNIQDLKSLLESRKGCWQREATSCLHSLGRVPTHNETHEFISRVTGIAEIPANTLISHSEDSNAVSKGGNRSSPRQASPNDVLCDSPHNQSHSHEVNLSKNISLLTQPRLQAHLQQNTAVLDVEDETIFFQELDAAYCAILEPETLGCWPLVKEPIERNISYTSGRNFREIDASVLISNAEGLVRAPEALLKTSLSIPLPSKTSPVSCSPIPPGFWTQKRLY